MPRQPYNKLVRDRIPEIIQAQGKQCATSVLDDADYRQALRAKLVEEAQEVAATEERAALLAELADVLEVVDAFCESYDIPPDELRVAQELAMIRRGRFERRLLLHWVEEQTLGVGTG